MQRFNRYNALFKRQNLVEELEFRWVPCISMRAESCARRYLFLEFLQWRRSRFCRRKKKLRYGSGLWYSRFLLLYYGFLGVRFKIILRSLVTSYKFFSVCSEFDNFNMDKFCAGRNVWVNINRFYTFLGKYYLGRSCTFGSLQAFWLCSPMQFFTLDEGSGEGLEDGVVHKVPIY